MDFLLLLRGNATPCSAYISYASIELKMWTRLTISRLSNMIMGNLITARLSLTKATTEFAVTQVTKAYSTVWMAWLGFVFVDHQHQPRKWFSFLSVTWSSPNISTNAAIHQYIHGCELFSYTFSMKTGKLIHVHLCLPTTQRPVGISVNICIYTSPWHKLSEH